MAFACSNNIQLNPDDVGLVLHRGSIGMHVGFFFQAREEKYVFLHLAFHKNVKFDPFPPADCSIAGKLPLSKVSALSLKSALRLIGARAQQIPSRINIPYGVNIDKAKGSFNSKGIYSIPKGSDGLTCSTFVTEVCQGVGLDILNESDWKARPSDANWINQICAMLSDPRSGADLAHTNHVRSSFNGIRIRPEEVASSVNLWKQKPIDFAPAEAEGLLLVQAVKQCCDLAATTDEPSAATDTVAPTNATADQTDTGDNAAANPAGQVSSTSSQANTAERH